MTTENNEGNIPVLSLDEPTPLDSFEQTPALEPSEKVAGAMFDMYPDAIKEELTKNRESIINSLKSSNQIAQDTLGITQQNISAQGSLNGQYRQLLDAARTKVKNEKTAELNKAVEAYSLQNGVGALPSIDEVARAIDKKSEAEITKRIVEDAAPDLLKSSKRTGDQTISQTLDYAMAITDPYNVGAGSNPIEAYRMTLIDQVKGAFSLGTYYDEYTGDIKNNSQFLKKVTERLSKALGLSEEGIKAVVSPTDTIDNKALEVFGKALASPKNMEAFQNSINEIVAGVRDGEIDQFSANRYFNALKEAHDRVSLLDQDYAEQHPALQWLSEKTGTDPRNIAKALTNFEVTSDNPLLSAVGLPALVKSSVKIIGKTINTAVTVPAKLRNFAKANKEAKDIITGIKKVSEATLESAQDYTLPTSMTGPVDYTKLSGTVAKAYALEQEKIKNFTNLGNDLFRTMSEEDRATVTEKFMENWEKTLPEQGTVLDSNIVENPDDGTLEAVIKLGYGDKTTFDTVKEARNAAKDLGFTAFNETPVNGLEIGQSVNEGEYILTKTSTGYELSTKRQIPTTGKGDLETDIFGVSQGGLLRNNPLTRFFAGPALTASNKTNKAVDAVVRYRRIVEAFAKDLAEPLNKLDKNAKKAVEAALVKSGSLDAPQGAGVGRWMDPDELKDFWKTSFSREITEQEMSAYYTAANIDNFSHMVKNDIVRKSLIAKGAVETRLKNGFKFIGKTTTEIPNTNKFGVYNYETGTFFKEGEMSKERLKELLDTGEYHLIFDIEGTGTVERTAGRKNVYYLVKKGNAEIHSVPEVVIPYVGAGRRYYKGRWSLKQSIINSSPYKDGLEAASTQKFHAGDKTHTISDDIVYLKDIEKRGNASLEAYKTAQKTQNFDEASKVIKENGIWNSYQELEEAIKKGDVIADQPFQVIEEGLKTNPFNHKGMGAYNFLPDEFVDISPELDMMRDSRAFWAERGAVLKNIDGRQAEMVSPFEAAQRALQAATSQASVTDFKLRYAENWVEQFKEVLRTPTKAETVVDRFLNAQFIDNPSRAQKLMIERAKSARVNVARVLRMPSAAEKFLDTVEDAIVDALDMGRLWASEKGKAVQLAYDGFYRTGRFLAENGLTAFDMIKQVNFYLLMGFRPFKWPAQMYQVTRALSVSPTQGAKAVLVHNAVKALIGMDKEIVKGVFSDFRLRKLYEAAGITERVMLDLKKAVEKLGVLQAANDISVRNAIKPTDINILTNKFLTKTSEVATFFLKDSEERTHLIATITAYLEKTEGGKIPFESLTKEDLAEIGRLATVHSGMMNAESKAPWERFTPWTAQFMSFQFRNMEAMLGKELTVAQKARIIATDIALLGAKGLPFGIGATKAWAEFEENEYDIIPDALRDGVIQNMFDAAEINVDISSMLTPSAFAQFINDFVVEKNISTLFTGAVQSSLNKFARGMSKMVELYQAPEEIPTRAYFDVAKDISTETFGFLGDYEKAYLMWNAHQLADRKGAVLANNVDFNLQTTLAVALGAPNTRTEEMYYKYRNLLREDSQEYQNIVKSAGEYLRKIDLDKDPELNRFYRTQAQAMIEMAFPDNPILQAKAMKAAMESNKEGVLSVWEKLMQRGLPESAKSLTDTLNVGEQTNGQ